MTLKYPLGFRLANIGAWLRRDRHLRAVLEIVPDTFGSSVEK